MAGLGASDKPVRRGELLLLPATDRPVFFVGQPLEAQKTLRTLLLETPPGQAQHYLNMMSHVACCSTLVHHESQQLWQPTADEHIARKHLKEAYIQSVEYISNPVLLGNAALGGLIV